MSEQEMPKLQANRTDQLPLHLFYSESNSRVDDEFVLFELKACVISRKWKWPTQGN